MKFVVEGETGVTLYSEGEETHILNFKRGIISTLIVPVMEKEQSKDMVQKHFIFKIIIYNGINCFLSHVARQLNLSLKQCHYEQIRCFSYR